MQQPLEDRLATVEASVQRHEQTIARLDAIIENHDQLLERLLTNQESLQASQDRLEAKQDLLESNQERMQANQEAIVNLLEEVRRDAAVTRRLWLRLAQRYGWLDDEQNGDQQNPPF